MKSREKTLKTFEYPKNPLVLFCLYKESIRVSFVLRIVFPGFKINWIYYFSTESLELIDIKEGFLNLLGDILSFEIMEISD